MDVCTRAKRGWKDHTRIKSLSHSRIEYHFSYYVWKAWFSACWFIWTCAKWTLCARSVKIIISERWAESPIRHMIACAKYILCAQSVENLYFFKRVEFLFLVWYVGSWDFSSQDGGTWLLFHQRQVELAFLRLGGRKLTFFVAKPFVDFSSTYTRFWSFSACNFKVIIFCTAQRFMSCAIFTIISLINVC